MNADWYKVEAQLYHVSLLWALWRDLFALGLVIVLDLFVASEAFAVTTGRRTRTKHGTLMSPTVRMIESFALGGGAVLLTLFIPLIIVMTVSDYRDGPHALAFVPQELQVQAHSGKSGTTESYLVWPVKDGQLSFETTAEVYDQLRPDRCYAFTYYGRPSWTQPIIMITDIRAVPQQQCGSGMLVRHP